MFRIIRMNKEEFVKSLTKVKLIIGNGFDLHCGLHTKYSDFYCKNIDKFLFINSLYDDYEKTNTLSVDEEKIKKLTTWDIFFVLNSSKDPQANKKWWCDIEALLLSSFISKPAIKSPPELTALYLVSKIHWDEIRRYIIQNTLATDHVNRFVVDFIRVKMNIQNLYPNDFYQFLLCELKEFEHGFGQFIYAQLHQTWYEYCNHGREFLHEPYIKMAMNTINELCDLNNLVAIDSFNYGDIRDQRVAGKLQNINGNIEAPIFGIDSIFEPKDVRFMFTKTGRRIDSDLFEPSYESKLEFENIVIFGHSLNQADYSYFFPLFDKLKLTDILATNVIVFAYSVYDKEKEDFIKNELREAIAKILYAYAVDKKLTNPSRFLDSLSTQKRIITYEISTLDRNRYGYSMVDHDWEEVYKKINSLQQK